MNKISDMDFKSFTEEAVKEITDLPLERRRPWVLRIRDGRTDMTADRARKILLGKVWGKSLARLNKRYPSSEPMAAEKALAALMRNGISRNRIRLRDNSFRLNLDNCQYRLYKHASAEGFSACPWPSEHQCTVRLSGKDFAGFVLAFDAAVPEIVARVPGVLRAVEERELAERKKEIELDLKKQFLQSVIDRFITPLGLSAHSVFKEGDVVSLDLEQIKTAHLEVPLWQLPEMLKNPAAVMNLLEKKRQD